MCPWHRRDRVSLLGCMSTYVLIYYFINYCYRNGRSERYFASQLNHHYLSPLAPTAGHRHIGIKPRSFLHNKIVAGYSFGSIDI